MASHIGRRKFLATLGAAAAWPLGAPAQQPDRMRRIGVLMGLVANDPEAHSRVVAFENGLRELGWVKERNLSIDYRWAGDGNVLRDHAAELLAMAPDLILANSTPVTTALREQSRAVPIVFTQVVDPVGQGLVPNLAHPGGNITGFTSFEFSIGTKWLEVLKQTAPRVTRIALLSTRRARRSPTYSCGLSRPRRLPSRWRRSGPPCATPPMSIACLMYSRENRMGA
jgi:putative tryptophan/tyrosine transport system substrate-binding protein